MADLLLGLQFHEQLQPAVKAELEQIMAAIQTWATDTVNTITSITNTKNPIVPPPGTICGFGGTTAPSGWLFCNGATISRVDYANLFTAIGVSFGAPSSTTFQIPDLRGRFPLGKAASGTGSTFAGTGGSLDHTHSISSAGSHSHTVTTGTTAAEASHTHTFADTSDNPNDNVTGGPSSTLEVQSGTGTTVASNTHTHLHNHTHDVSGTTGAGSSHTHGAGTLATDSQGSHNHGGATGTGNPAFLAINYIIKT